MNDTILFIPSYNRAMQLDLLLRSYYKHCQTPNIVDCHVLYKCDDLRNQKSYDTLISEYPNVKFTKEQNFKLDLLNIIDGYNYYFFSVDDTIFIKDFNIEEIIEALTNSQKNLVFSLRMGQNTSFCYPNGLKMGEKRLKNGYKRGILINEWIFGEYDFSYPLEVSSSIFEKSTLFGMLQELSYSNPNTLESALDSMRFTQYHKPYMLMYETSCAFSSPMNRVQKVNNNRFSNIEYYSADNLLELFLQGKRIDMKKFEGIVPNAAHMEVEFDFSDIVNL